MNKTPLNHFRYLLILSFKILLWLIPFAPEETLSQDIIYSTPYPNGIITNNLKSGAASYGFSPIDNPELHISVRKKDVIKIKYASGEVFINDFYTNDKIIVLETEDNTGKIIYSDVYEFEELDKKLLFNSVLQISTGKVELNALSSDNENFTFQKYEGKFLTHFAGDPYYIHFNLLIKFKDGRLKYELSDFVAVFEKVEHTYNMNVLQGGVKSISDNHVKSLDSMFGNNRSDQDKFWKPIKENILLVIYEIYDRCEDSKNENDW